MTGPAAPRWGYNTNGFANHRLDDALTVVSELGYRSIALTLDNHHLDPFAPDAARQVREVGRRVEELGLAVVVETGARYLLDIRHKHWPSLVSPDNEPRVRLLKRAVDIAADLGAEAVSFWSGTDRTGEPAAAWRQLTAGVAQLLPYAEARGVRLGFEPEPGMLVHDLAGYARLRAELGEPEVLGLTLDIGHCECVEPMSVPDCVRWAAPYLVNVQIDDMVRDVHEHLEFGAGTIDFPPVLAALAACGYRGIVAVELPRHSHAAPETARRSLEFLRAAARDGGQVPAVSHG
ncbi:sugar phosphate isomerase/epimerase family protein [Streptomyces acidiscabies]|uniref:sugar phosphate isomerase/epimerase family protein n=1 Tax=Streptomyces acidiscabies TaxID=42234 RepID=UPI00067A9213|nr:sugar phosphate isomerase/epimerase family protein [Streptomyces acidiscabies]